MVCYDSQISYAPFGRKLTSESHVAEKSLGSCWKDMSIHMATNFTKIFQLPNFCRPFEKAEISDRRVLLVLNENPLILCIKLFVFFVFLFF